MSLRTLCSMVGGLAAGPLGSLVGNIAGGLVGAAAESLLPGSAGVLSNALSATSSEALHSLGVNLGNLSPSERQQINHDLQTSFRAASLEALSDLGGPHSFPSAWSTARDVPSTLIFPFERYQAQAALLSNCLVQIQGAIKDQQLLPLEPPRDLSEASVYSYVRTTSLDMLSQASPADQQTLEQLSANFFDRAIAPWLEQEFSSLMRAAVMPQDATQQQEHEAGQALRAHLRRYLLERSLVHLNEQLKSPEHTRSWRAFNRLLLEQMRASIDTLGDNQQQILQRLDVLLSQENAQTLGQFAGGMADLIATVGRAQQQTNERLDDLLLRVTSQGDNVLLLLTQNREIRDIVEKSHLSLQDMRKQLEIILDALALIKYGARQVGWLIPSAFQDEQYCPYPGLAVFGEQQAELFYGREKDIQSFLQRPFRPITAITGPSGIGKSSFVQAGLLPKLKQREGASLLTLVYRVSTSAELLRDLASFCASQSSADPQTIFQNLSQHDDALRDILMQLRSTPDGKLLLVLDQFEEIFVGDDAARAFDRQRLLANLLYIDANPEPALSIILTTRENFFEHKEYKDNEQLYKIVQAENIRLAGLTDYQLREAITRPLDVFSAKHGLQLSFETGVVELMIRDFLKTERTLPLVQYLLRLLWTEQHELSNTAYNNLGGLEKALDRHASLIYRSFNENEQRLVNAVLLALVRPGIGNEYTRRRVRRELLIGGQSDQAAMTAVIQRLAHPNSRLISEQQSGDAAYLELTHEVLLRQWERLQVLIELHEKRLRTREALLPNAEQWLQSKTGKHPKGDSAYLYRGNQLSQARDYVQTKDYPEQVDSSIRDCYQSSAQHRQRIMLLSVVGAIAALLLIWGGFQVFTAGIRQQQQEAQQARQTAELEQARAQQTAQAEATQRAVAENQRAQAQQTAQVEATQRVGAETAKEREARISRARELAVAANDERSNGRITRAGLLALEAVNTALSAGEVVTVESEQALRDALNELGGRPLYGHTFSLVGMLFSPDGHTLVTRAADRTARVWDLTASDPRKTVKVLGNHVDSYRTNPLEATPLQISPDGHTLITVSGDNTIHVWDLTSPDPNSTVRILNPDPAAKLPGVVLRKDGRTLISTSDGQLIRIWNLADPDPSATVRTIGTPVTGEQSALEFGFGPAPIMLAGDDRTLIAINSKGLIHIWDLVAPDPAATVRTLQLTETAGVPFTTDTVVLSPDGKTLAASEHNNNVLVWDLSASDLAATKRVLSGHKDWVNALAFSPDSRLLASGSRDATVRVWSVSEPDPSTTASILEGHSGPVSRVLFSPDGRQLASVGGGGIRLWQQPEPSPYSSIISSRSFPTGGPLAFSPDGSVLATGSSDIAAIRLWNLSEPDSAAMQHRLSAPTIQSPFLFGPDGHTLIANSDNATVSSWDLALADANSSMNALLPKGAGRLLTQSADRQLLVTEDSGRMIQVWDLSNAASPRRLHTLQGHTREVSVAWMSTDKHWLISGSWDGSVRIWDLTLPAPATSVRILNAHETIVDHVLLRADGHTLISTSDTTARIWDLDAADPQQSVQTVSDTSGLPLITALSPDGRYFVTGITYAGADTENNVIRIWDLTATNPASTEHVLHQNILTSALLFSADGHTLIAGEFGAAIRIWYLSVPDPASSLRVVQGQARADILALSPDGHMLANVRTGLSQPIISLVDLTAPDPNTTVRVLQNTDEARKLTFSPDGRMLVSGDGSLNIVQVWAMDVRDLLTPACRTIGRNLTADEWQQYFGSQPYRRTCPDEPEPDPAGSASATQATPTAVATAQVEQPSALPTATQSASATPAATAIVNPTQELSATAPTSPENTTALNASTYASQPGAIVDLELAPDGQSFAMVGQDGAVELYKTSDGTLVRRFSGNRSAVSGLSFSADGQRLAARAEQGGLYIWQVENEQVKVGLANISTAHSFSPDGQTIAIAQDDYTVRLVQVENGKTLRSFEGTAIEVAALTFTPDGTKVIAASPDDGVFIWNVSDGALLHRLSIRTMGSQMIAIASDNRTLAVCDRAGIVNLWNINDGSLIRQLTEITDTPFHYSVAFSADSQMLISISNDLERMDLNIWRAENGTVINSIPMGPYIEGSIEARATPGGQLYIIAGEGSETVHVWSLAMP